jgi:hypothetical protein
MPRDDGHFSPFVEQRLDDAEAEATGATRDDGDLIVQIHGVSPLLLLQGRSSLMKRVEVVSLCRDFLDKSLPQPLASRRF